HTFAIVWREFAWRYSSNRGRARRSAAGPRSCYALRCATGCAAPGWVRCLICCWRLLVRPTSSCHETRRAARLASSQPVFAAPTRSSQYFDACGQFVFLGSVAGSLLGIAQWLVLRLQAPQVKYWGRNDRHCPGHVFLWELPAALRLAHSHQFGSRRGHVCPCLWRHVRFRDQLAVTQRRLTNRCS